MVFEKIVAEALNRLLGDYFENVDSSQLKLGIWGGDVVLKNLMLKQSALDDLGPFRVSVGKLGNLTMKIPWTSLYTAPVIMNLEDLHLLVMPATSVNYNSKAEEESAFASKQKEINRIEEARVRESMRDKVAAELQDDSFVEKLVAQIIKNVQIRVESIHIRYEDPLSLPERPFSFGCILGSFVVQTTDENWKPQIITEIVHVIHKLIDLNGLSVYWNSDSEMLSTSGKSKSEILVSMKDMVLDSTRHRYILRPIMAQAKLKLVPNPERGSSPFTLPRMYIDIILQDLALGMTNFQFQDLTRLMEALEYMSRSEQYRKYRPNVTRYTGNAKTWWKFAYRCIVEEEVRRRRLNWDWNHIKQHRELCRVYAQAYYEKKSSKKNKAEVDAKVSHCERVLDVFNIMLIRKQVDVKLDREALVAKIESVNEPKQTGGWLSWNSWFGPKDETDSPKTSDLNIAMQLEQVFTPEEKRKLYQAIDYAEDSAPLDYPLNFREYVVKFSLTALTFTLRDEESKVQGARILYASVQEFGVQFATRPAQKGMDIEATIADMLASGLTNSLANGPLVLKVNKLVGATDLLLKVNFQIRPVDSSVHTRINVAAEPLELIYHGKTIQAIQQCFSLPAELRLQKLQAAAVTTIEEWRLQSASGLQYMLSKRGETELTVGMKAPIIVIPQDGKIEKPGSVLVINLGYITVSSEPRKKLTHQPSFEEIKETSYDKLLVTLRDFQVLMCLPNEKYEDQLAKMKQDDTVDGISPELFVVQSKELRVQLEQSLVKDDPRFEWMKIYAHLPLLDFNVAENRMIQLVTLIATLPLPKSAETAEDEILVNMSDIPAVNEYAAISRLTYNSDAIGIGKRKGSEIVNYNELVLTVEVDRVSLQVTKYTDVPSPQPLANLDLVRLSATVTQKTFGIGIFAEFGGISFQMPKFSYPGLEGPLYLLKSLMIEGIDTPLLTVDLYSITPTCPPSLATDVKQQIRANISALDIVLHLEALQSVMKFAEGCQRSITSSLPKDTGHEKASSDVVSVSSQDQINKKRKAGILEARKNAITKKHNNPDDVLLKVDAVLESLAIQLSTTSMNLVRVVFHTMTAEFTQKMYVSDAKLELSHLKAFNLGQASVYDQLIQVDADKVLNVHVIMYENDPSKAAIKDDINQRDMDVKIQTGSPRIVYLGHIITDILTFLNAFVDAKEAIMNASTQAAGIARTNVEQAYSSASKISMDIVLRAPKIVIPRNEKSNDAFIADLGLLTLRNSFEKLNTKQNKQGAVVDNMELTLSHMKLHRVVMDGKKAKSKVHILDPITLNLLIKRNLSSTWFHDIPDIKINGSLDAASAKISNADYSALMIALTENINAPGRLEIEVPQMHEVAVTENGQEKTRRGSNVMKAINLMKGKLAPVKEDVPEPEPAQSRWSALELDFQIDVMALELFESQDDGAVAAEDEENRDSTFSFAKLQIVPVTVRVQNWSNKDSEVNVVVGNITLEDSRPGNRLVRHVVRRKNLKKSIKPIVEVVYKADGGKTVPQTVVIETEGIAVLLCLDYLLKLSTFFIVTAEKNAGTKPVEELTEEEEKPVVEAPHHNKNDEDMHILFKLGETEVLLVENMKEVQHRAILLNCHVNMKQVSTGGRSNLMGTVADITVCTTSFDKDAAYEKIAEVISPFSLTLVMNTAYDSMLVDVNVSDIFIRLNAATLDLLLKISAGVTSSENDDQKEITNEYNFLKFWDVKPVSDMDPWYLHPEKSIEVGTDATTEKAETRMNQYEQTESKTEKAVVETGTFVITFESGANEDSIPLLLLESDMDMQVFDWSSKLSVAGRLKLEAAYYNTKFGVWEYMIEPVEARNHGKVSHKPWEMLFEYNTTPESPDDLYESNKPFMGITLQSNDVLELTVSRATLDVLNLLNDELQATIAANDSDALRSKRTVAHTPYVFTNDLGIPIRLNLKGSSFLCQGSTCNLELESGQTVTLALENSQDMTKHTSVLREQEGWEERILKFEIDHFGFTAEVPVNRAEKRFYPLGIKTEFGETYGVLCDIVVEDCSKHIYVRSIVQIINELPVAIKIYVLTDEGTAVESIATVESNSVFNVPLAYVYTKSCEFYFAPDGYSHAPTPFTWGTLVSDIRSEDYFVCEPMNQGVSFNMLVIGEIKQAFLEATSRRTLASKSCFVYLRPPVVMHNLLPIDLGYFTERDSNILVTPNGESITATNIPVSKAQDFCFYLTIDNYHEVSWRAKIEIDKNTPELSAWDFVSENGADTMALGIHKKQKDGSYFLQVYAPFWMVNRTGIDLYYKGDIKDTTPVIRHSRTVDHPIMFSYKGKAFFSKKKAVVRFKESDWSESFSLDVAGSGGTVTCKAPRKEFQIGLDIQLMSWGLTKSLIFSPRFLLISRCSYDLRILETQKEKTHDSKDTVTLVSNSCMSFWPNLNDPYLAVNIEGTTEWTKLIRYDNAHHTLLKLVNKYGGVYVDVQVTEVKTIITFTEFVEGHAPALLVNTTNACAIEFFEKNEKHGNILLPKYCQYVAWDEPMGSRTLEWGPASFGRKFTLTDKLHSDGMGRFPWTDEKNAHYMFYWISFLDGLQRVLLFTEDEEVVTFLLQAKESDHLKSEYIIMFHGLGLSLVDGDKGTELMYMKIGSSDIMWQSAKMGKAKRYKPLPPNENNAIEMAYQTYLNEKAISPHVNAHIILDSGIEVDFSRSYMIKPAEKEIRRVFQTGIWVHHKQYVHSVHIHAKLYRIQADNQTLNCTFPVMLAPVLPPKSVASQNEPLKPFAEVSIMQRVTAHSAVTQYKYFKVLIQEFVVRADVQIINALVELFSPTDSKADLQQAQEYYHKDFKELCTPAEIAFTKQFYTQGQKHFYDYLHFSPLKIHLSFSMGGAAQFESNLLNLLTQSVGVSVTEVQDVVFKLACWEVQHEILTGQQIMNALMDHYKSQALKQFYVLIFGLDVIGNPYGLVVGVTQGVEAFFYEPIQGMIQGPGEFAEGLVLGCRTLIGSTVGGAAGALSRITGTLGKGMAALTLDEEFKQKRRENLAKRPQDAMEGLARSGKGLAMGFYDGITGIVTQPVKGAQQDGFEGFFKGIGKGVVGVFLRPATGIVDFTSGSLDAVKRATSVNDDIKRLRPPRRVSTENAIKPYIQHEAEGIHLLKEIEKGKYISTDHYVAHALVNPHGVFVLLLTNKRLFYLRRDEIFGGWNINWVHLWGEFAGLPVVIEKGLLFTLAPKQRKFKLMGRPVEVKLKVPMYNPDACAWILSKIENAMKSEAGIRTGVEAVTAEDTADLVDLGITTDSN